MLRPSAVLLLAAVLSACSAGSDGAGPGSAGSDSAPLTTSVATSASIATTSTSPSTTSAPTTSTVVARVPASGRTTEGSLVTPDGRQRTYRVYRPASVPADQPAPLVVALHGGTGWGAQFEANSGFSEVAEAHGVVVVYPDGTGVGPENALRTWNAGYCCGSAANQDIDDVEFVRLLLDEIGEGVPIDGDRVYAIGHSNGGMLAYRLACELSDRIVAIALQAGSLGVDRCSPTDPVSVLHLHGVADENHPIDGGVGPRSIAGVDFRSAQSSVEAMARAIGCQEDPIRTSTPPLTRTQWTPCPAGATVELVAVDGAVHAWMGGNARAGGPDQQTNPDDLDVDASVLAWQFLASHSRGG